MNRVDIQILLINRTRSLVNTSKQPTICPHIRSQDDYQNKNARCRKILNLQHLQSGCETLVAFFPVKSITDLQDAYVRPRTRSICVIFLMKLNSLGAKTSCRETVVIVCTKLNPTSLKHVMFFIPDFWHKL